MPARLVLLRQPIKRLMADGEIVHADAVTHLGTVAAGAVDMVLFSPPYDGIRTYNGFDLDLAALGDEFYRVLKEGGVVACVINDGTKDFAKSLTTARLQVDWVDRVGLRLFECCIYSRHGRPGAWWSQRFRVDHEYILIFFKGARPKFFDKRHMRVPAKYAGSEWHGTDRLTDGSVAEVERGRFSAADKCRGTVWEYSSSSSEGNRLKLQHPATYPDALAADLIRCFTEVGDLVCDPTCGSGTSCVVAAHLGRRYLGIDISSEYCSLARARLDVEVRDCIL